MTNLRNPEEPRKTAAFYLDDEQLAIIRQYAKEMGYPSSSSALRRIIQEWAQFKQAQLPLPTPQPCQ